MMMPGQQYLKRWEAADTRTQRPTILFFGDRDCFSETELPVPWPVDSNITDMGTRMYLSNPRVNRAAKISRNMSLADACAILDYLTKG